MVYTKPETAAEILKECDKYGDIYTKDTNIEALVEVFTEVQRQEPNLGHVTEYEMVTLENRYLSTVAMPMKKLW